MMIRNHSKHPDLVPKKHLVLLKTVSGAVYFFVETMKHFFDSLMNRTAFI